MGKIDFAFLERIEKFIGENAFTEIDFPIVDTKPKGNVYREIAPSNKQVVTMIQKNNMDSVKDIAKLLGTTKNKLIYFLYVIPEEKKYSSFNIKKKNGKDRIITAPICGIKTYQRRLNNFLQNNSVFKKNIHGFVKGKNIISNATPHINKNLVINLDLVDFFPSINFGRVYGLFKGYPFNCSNDVAAILAKLCCHKGSLPQGAPTSPIISNLICYGLDNNLIQLAKKNKLTYTRYADDITFSTHKPDVDQLIIDEIKSIIKAEGFQSNEAKFHKQNSQHRQVVTGLLVNKKVNISRKYIRNVRAILHSIEKEGMEKANEKWLSLYPKNKLNKLPSFRKVLLGRINFIGIVRKKDEVYQKLFAKCKVCFNINKNENIKPLEIIPSIVESGKDEKKKEIEIKHNPRNLAKFFTNFSSGSNSDSKLWQLVHQEGPDDIKGLESIMIDIDKFITPNQIKGYKYLPVPIYARIMEGLIKLWKEDGGNLIEKFGVWPYRPNEEDSVPEIIEFTRKIELFKNDIRLKWDDTLPNNVTKIIKNKFNSSKYEITCKGDLIFDFYTWVEGFTTTLTIIKNMILEYNKNDLIKLKIYSDEEGQGDYTLSHLYIENTNSVDVVKFSPHGDTSLIKKCLNSICDFSYMFRNKENQVVQKMILPEKGEIIIDNDNVKGFTYKITFYEYIRQYENTNN